jgi:AraC-like DNA-binding protein
VHKFNATGLIIEPIDKVEISPLAIDAFFSSLIKHCKDMIGDQSLIEGIELMRPEPKNFQVWGSFFNCPVTFNAEHNCFWMNKGKLEQPTNMGDVVLAHQNEQVVQRYLEKMNSASWSERCSQVIQKALSNHEPTLTSVASVFNITDRTLSRRLKEEGTSFRQLLQKKRLELAEYYLSSTAKSITEITYNLAFTDTSNFSRAFQRWKGMTPSEYRALKS